MRLVGSQRRKLRERLTELHLWLPILPPGLNGSGGLMRLHWRAQGAQKLAVCRAIFDAIGPSTPPMREPVVLQYTRATTGRRHDWDNLGASFKFVGDALVTMGLLSDDSTREIIRFTTVAKPVSTRAEQGTGVYLRTASDTERDCYA